MTGAVYTVPSIVISCYFPPFATLFSCSSISQFAYQDAQFGSTLSVMR
jgi:hypothetical protein